MTPKTIFALTALPLAALPLAALLVSLATGAAAYDGPWLVTQDINTQTCYRMTAAPQGENWHTLGLFNTFREAGMWTWEHRDVCKDSPVFH